MDSVLLLILVGGGVIALLSLMRPRPPVSPVILVAPVEPVVEGGAGCLPIVAIIAVVWFVVEVLAR